MKKLSFRQEIIGAVARGWTHPVNAKKIFDNHLADAIVAEVLAQVRRSGYRKPTKKITPATAIGLTGH